MQKENGGFAGDDGKETNVAPTSAAIRAIKYLGGEIPNPGACEKFILSKREPSGGYRTQIKINERILENKVHMTAVAVMALVELKKDPETISRETDFLIDYAKDFEEIRIAAAALEAVYGGQIKFPIADRWIGAIQQAQNADGSWGAADGRARDTASAVVTILRLGGKIADKEAILEVLKSGQRSDGGWGKLAAPGSDLETTYRVMRAFAMLKGKPDTAACHAFVAKCRRENGSYKPYVYETSQGPGGGQGPPPPDSVSNTYFATVISHWLETMKP
jgi:prenyltransferase beta subunit